MTHNIVSTNKKKFHLHLRCKRDNLTYISDHVDLIRDMFCFDGIHLIHNMINLNLFLMKKMGFPVHKMHNITDICILGIVDKSNLYLLPVKACYVKIKLEI